MNIGLGILGAMGDAAKEGARLWREDDIRAENQRMEMEKEARIEQASIRREDREYGRTKETEQRQIANRGMIAQQDIDIANKPENVQAKANAEKVLAQAKVDVELDPNNLSKKLALKQAELDMQAASQIKVHNATDTTDYEGRKLQNQVNQLKLDQLKAGGNLTESEEKKVDYLKNNIKETRRSAASLLSQDSGNLYAKDLLEQASADEKELNAFFEKKLGKTNETSAKPTDAFAEFSNATLNPKAKETPKETAPTSVNVPVPEQNASGIPNKEELAGEQLPYRKGMAGRGILSSKQQLDKAIRDIQKDDTLTPKQKELQIKELTKQQ